MLVEQEVYRWRRGEHGVVDVWQPLRPGRLRFIPPPGRGPGFAPSSVFVVRAIRMVLARGWQRDASLVVRLEGTEFEQLAVSEPTVSPPDLVAMALEDFDLPPLQGPLALRVLLCIGDHPVVIEAGEEVVVRAFEWGPKCFAAAADDDWLRDVWVEVHQADRSASCGRSAAVWWVGPTGRGEWTGSIDDPLARVAGAGLWRLAMGVSKLEARRLLEPVHAALELPDPPWEVHAGRRVIRLFGELRPHDAAAFLALLGRRGWVLDARGMTSLDPDLRAALASTAGLADVWVGAAGRVDRPTATSVEAARALAGSLMLHEFVRRLEPHLVPSVRDQVIGDLKRSGLVDLEHALLGTWRPAQAPRHAAWLQGEVHWTPRQRPPWLALCDGQLYAALPSGRTLVSPALPSSGRPDDRGGSRTP